MKEEGHEGIRQGGGSEWERQTHSRGRVMLETDTPTSVLCRMQLLLGAQRFSPCALSLLSFLQSPISSCMGGVLPPRHFPRAAGGEKNRIMAGEVCVLLSKPRSLSSRHGLACSTPMSHLHTHPSPRWSAMTGNGGCPSSCGKRQHKLLRGS